MYVLVDGLGGSVFPAILHLHYALVYIAYGIMEWFELERPLKAHLILPLPWAGHMELLHFQRAL